MKEVLENLKLKEGAVVVDATLGGGGHSLSILKKIGPTGKLIALDQDQRAVDDFRKRISEPEFGSQSKVVDLVKGNFSEMKNILRGQGIITVDAVLADLGFSSDQMEKAERGFSFQKEARLDMRLDQDQFLTAEKVVNEYSQRELEKVLKDFGEERFYHSIAKKITEARKKKKIETTLELAEIISSGIPARFRRGKIHPATRTFQAIRIEVNGELENLKKFIPQAIDMLAVGGRLVIISFHSLEDRIVKNILRENARGCICPVNFPQCRCGNRPKIKVITKKPIIPSEEEIGNNLRSRSAKMRIGEKICP